MMAFSTCSSRGLNGGINANFALDVTQKVIEVKGILPQNALRRDCNGKCIE